MKKNKNEIIELINKLTEFDLKISDKVKINDLVDSDDAKIAIDNSLEKFKKIYTILNALEDRIPFEKIGYLICEIIEYLIDKEDRVKFYIKNNIGEFITDQKEMPLSLSRKLNNSIERFCQLNPKIGTDVQIKKSSKVRYWL